jgi:glucose-1-phosphate cytidylyltransferase
MVTYGDGVADVDISRLVEFHMRHGKLATVTTVRPVSRFGILEVAENGLVESFAEKPASPGWASAGFFVYHRDALDYFDDSPDCVMEREPLERLAAAGQLMAYRHEGFFFAMDTYREYRELQGLWDGGQPPWKVWS